jgi:hypothetical protein
VGMDVHLHRHRVVRAGDRNPASVLITDADGSRLDEHGYRARRYALTMAIRVICLLVAVLVRGTAFMWVAIAGAVVLPWAAVIMANDRLPKKHRLVAWHDGVVSPDRALGHSRDDRVIDGAAATTDEDRPSHD